MQNDMFSIFEKMYLLYEIMRIWQNFLLYYALNAYALIVFKPRDESAP